MRAMTISSAERTQLRTAVRELLDDACTEEHVRRVMTTDDGFDRRLWQQLAERGVAGMLVDGEYGWDAVAEALDLAVIAPAGEQVGGSRRMFDTTVEYLKTRIQFGRTIGSFQALKHMAADLFLELESATSAAQHAAAEHAEGGENAAGAIALAGFACAEAYQTITMAAIQMHGGIGFTWEHPAHLYARRARTGVQLFGAPRLYRERYLTSKGA